MQIYAGKAVCCCRLQDSYWDGETKELLCYWLWVQVYSFPYSKSAMNLLQAQWGSVQPFLDFCSRKNLEIFLNYTCVGSPSLQLFVFHLLLSNLLFARPFLCNGVVETIAQCTCSMYLLSILFFSEAQKNIDKTEFSL